jgi:sirohydrochlorin ferrochelatase
MATIMKDYGVAASAHPGQDRLILVSHGPERPENNPAELALLEKHAAAIRRSSNFKDIKVVSIEDDAVPPVRAAHVTELRGFIQEATDQGRAVVIVPMILTKGGFNARLQKDLAGLDFTFANKGIIEHPLFQEWITDTLRAAIGS